VHLKEKDKAFFNGVELEISDMIENQDVSFFPRKKMFKNDLVMEEENADSNQFCKEMLVITNRIKGDVKKIIETLDAKMKK